MEKTMADNSGKKLSNVKIGLILAAVAMLISLWPIYVLNLWANG